MELKLNKFYDLVKSFGYIEYKIDDTTKKFKDIESKVSNKASKKNIVFLGVNRELLNATEVNFIFNIRGKKYIYKVK